MIYTLSINQEKCLEWGITLAQGALIDAINRASSWAKPRIVEGVKYFWVSRNKLLDEIPLAYSKADTIYRAFKLLVKKGLITYIKEGRNDMVCLTEKGKTWNVKGTIIGDAMLEEKTLENPNSEINPSKVGNKSELKSEINPTDNTTIYKTIINKKDGEINLTKKTQENLDQNNQENHGEVMNEYATGIAERALKKVQENKPVKLPKRAHEVWRLFYAKQGHGTEIIKMTGADRGKLDSAQKVLGDEFPVVVEYVMTHWVKYSSHVYKNRGLHNKPMRPDIAFFNKYCADALEFMNEAIEEQSESIQTSSSTGGSLKFPSWFKG